MSERNDDDARRVNWKWVAAWTAFGVGLLCLAAVMEGLDKWAGVSIDILVHIGATLLLAPLLPFLERSLTRSVVEQNRRMVQEETAGLRTEVSSLATQIDQLQRRVDEEETEKARGEDRIITALENEVSFTNVANAMTVANAVGALPEGEVTIGASLDPMIDIVFSWQFHMGDGRFSEPSGNFLGVRALVAPDPGRGTPVIETIWWVKESAESVIRRINEKLRERDRWNGQGTVNWEQVFRDLHRAIILSVACKRRDTTASWQLHGGLYELHGEDWAITEAGIEYRPIGQVVLSETDFPSATDPLRSSRLSDPFVWAPDPPDGAPAKEWRHMLWRGLFHFPLDHGPVARQPTRYPWKEMPAASQP